MSPSDIRQERQRLIEGGRKGKPFLVLAFVQRRALLILVLGALLSLVLLPFALSLAKPIYKTEALLLVNPAKEPTLTGRERDIIPGNIGDYTRTLVSRITGLDIVQEALQRLPATNRPLFLRSSDEGNRNAFRLMARIKVADVPRTYLIAARMSAEDPEHLGTMLNAVLETFLEKIGREQERMYERRLTYLREERASIQERIERQRGALLELASGAGTKAFLHDAPAVHLNRVEQIQRLYWEAEAVRAEKEGLLAKALRDQQEIGGLDLQPFADERVADNFGINRIEQWTYEQLQLMRAGIDGLTAENPDRKYVESRMDAMNGYLDEYKKRVNVETIRNLREKREFELEAEVLRARSTAAAAADASGVLRGQLERARADADAVSEAIFQSSGASFTIAQLRDRLTALDNRIDDCELEAKTPLSISIDKRAENPASPTSTNRNFLLLISLVAGFGAVFAGCLAFDFVDNRIRGPREVELALGAPGPDPIPLYASGAAFARATLDDAGHPAVRAVRDLALRLNHERERHGGKVFALAGLEPGCGVTSLAIQVAHALAALCPDVWLLETNVERPGLRTALALPPGPGLETALGGEEPAADLWRTEPARKLRVLAAEGKGLPASHLKLLDLLTTARQAAGVVVVDAGCLLTDELGIITATHADAVILVAREDASLYRHLRRAIDQLVQAGVPALTAVLNQSRPGMAQSLVDRLQGNLGVVSRLHRAVLERVRDFRRRPRA